ncbi:hypothetical protein GOBAR_AA26010 [Gossypium barbadense]|uniref:Uncharacterized protein n=1 Tax=Gossypium barbadense TaxID=3634 RepID=A0A2P5WU74_GOSBA|nr:hypothetical protein GOBAR_AA26010 [Gossypium barbadense]
MAADSIDERIKNYPTKIGESSFSEDDLRTMTFVKLNMEDCGKRSLHFDVSQDIGFNEGAKASIEFKTKQTLNEVATWPM